ncbi:MAG TPA: carboxypeptidase-like regulatory domain-containing protein [Ureibacillus sp.]|nr:carboxypeptidase-like regulatory domain-containing protein [Ureibacillus sp.]
MTGSVRLPDGTRIPFETVMIFTSNNVPFDHTNSNAAGQFSFPRVPVGSYFITAAEPSYLTPIRIPTTVQANRNTSVIITLQADSDGSKNAIFGIVKNSTVTEDISWVFVHI